MRFSAFSLLLFGLLLIPGCTEEINPEPQAGSATAQEEPQSDPVGGYGRQGGGSALGKAKQSAQGTVDAVQQRSAEVAEEIEEPE